jgi:hypothetical protein
MGESGVLRISNICSEVVWTNDLGLVAGELQPDRNITNNASDSSTYKRGKLFEA